MKIKEKNAMLLIGLAAFKQQPDQFTGQALPRRVLRFLYQRGYIEKRYFQLRSGQIILKWRIKTGK